MKIEGGLWPLLHWGHQKKKKKEKNSSPEPVLRGESVDFSEDSEFCKGFWKYSDRFSEIPKILWQRFHEIPKILKISFNQNDTRFQKWFTLNTRMRQSVKS